ncbi:hypothetical protein G7Y89_g12643 [Cudoniella acicularis]|uniref:Uncharacterized protein n=1 Tax=Cudoniella acicularis TaxID=354080 RepID=A0A8H4RB47_9HELO|nr:hypothetical protein G7Y89_g12643 [Cudoniella acicularis]
MSIDERKRLIDGNIYFFYKKLGYRANAYPDKPAGRGQGTFRGRGRGRSRGRGRGREVEDANGEVLPFTDTFIEEVNLRYNGLSDESSDSSLKAIFVNLDLENNNNVLYIKGYFTKTYRLKTELIYSINDTLGYSTILDRESTVEYDASNTCKLSFIKQNYDIYEKELLTIIKALDY